MPQVLDGKSPTLIATLLCLASLLPIAAQTNIPIGTPPQVRIVESGFRGLLDDSRSDLLTATPSKKIPLTNLVDPDQVTMSGEEAIRRVVCTADMVVLGGRRRAASSPIQNGFSCSQSIR